MIGSTKLWLTARDIHW